MRGMQSKVGQIFDGGSESRGSFDIAANGSRRGYNANKRSQAAQIAAQNGMSSLGYDAFRVGS